MKALRLGIGFLLFASSSGAISSPQPHHTPPIAAAPPAEQRHASAAPAASPYLPPGVSLREIFHFYKSDQERHATMHHFPQNWYDIGWRHVGNLGFISSTPFENSRPLYTCQLNGIAWAFFTHTDPTCGGHFLTNFGLLGYISNVPLPDTAPLYRCHYMFRGQLTHFNTFLANCGNVPTSVNDGIQGYVFL